MIPPVLDETRIDAFARHLRDSDQATPFDFCSLSEGFIYPERGQPGTLDTFFFCCAHQFGFWTTEGARWAEPMIARLDGRDLKGSDYLWRAGTRANQANPGIWSPASLAAMQDAQLNELFQEDSGHNPLPMWPEHLELIRGYSAWFTERDLRPADMIRQLAAESHPLRALLLLLSHIPGYAEDPLQKKAMLLAITLENRPEHFLPISDPESAVPIIDYHLQRSALRTGLIRIKDPTLRAKLEAREFLAADEEAAIRQATYHAVEKLIALSGLSAAAVDWFFFKNRTGCPEMTAPDCAQCPVRDLCAQDTGLFQPVFRTTSY